MIPRDEYNLARDIISGYERRKTKYISDIEEALDTLHATRFDTLKYSGADELFPVERAEERVLSIEKGFNARCVQAVNHAFAGLLIDINDDDWASKIFDALVLNAQDSHRYSYTFLEKTMNLFLSKRTFYRIKERYYGEIVAFMEA
jgi:hypothetical protein